MPTEVLVRVHAASVNPVDAIIRAGIFPLLGEPPFVLGWDISGVVEHVVPGVTRFQEGDEVFGMPFFPRPASAYADYVVAPSRQLARKPRSIDHAQAAALPMAGLTAWQSLVDVADVKPDDRVLIHGAGGGVGHLAVQIAKSRGAYVIGTASAGKHDLLRSLGADALIDYRTHDFGAEVRDVDLVLDLIAGGYAERSIDVLRPGGLLVTAIERTNTELAARVEEAGRRFAGISVEPDRVGLEALAALADAGDLHVHLKRVIPLEQAAAAHALVEGGGLTGKVVLTL
ncbi:MAG: NADP-dependent oxidoreductase [Acidimicrobiaceae bacterium]|nr:NADP-dependent oxidoreductase [Acidimicrobiaceae bacterium]